MPSQEVRLFVQPHRFPTNLFRQLLRCLEVAASQLVGLAATLEASADLALPQLAAGKRGDGGGGPPLLTAAQEALCQRKVRHMCWAGT